MRARNPAIRLRHKVARGSKTKESQDNQKKFNEKLRSPRTLGQECVTSTTAKFSNKKPYRKYYIRNLDPEIPTLILGVLWLFYGFP